MKIRAPAFRIGTAYTVEFSPDGEHCLVIGRDTVLWSVPGRKRVRSNRMLSHPSSASFSPSGNSFAIKNTAGEILVCDTATADPISRFVPIRRDEGPGPLYLNETTLLDGSWTGEIRCRPITDLAPIVLWHREGSMVSSLACAATTPLWAFAVGHKATTSDLPPDPDQLLISAGPTVEPFRCLPTSFSFLREIALSPDGSRLAVRAGTPDHFLSIVDVATGVESARVQVTQGGTGWELCWAPDASVVVVVEDGGFSFRSPTDLREIGWLAIEYPASIAFAPSGAFIALGTWSGGVVAPWPDFKEALGVRDASSSPPAP